MDRRHIRRAASVRNERTKSKDVKIREQVDRLGRPTVELLEQEIARHERKEAYLRLARGALCSVLMAAAVIMLVTQLWVTVLQVNGSSMSPQLEMDDFILSIPTNNLLAGDIIAFNREGRLHVKRVIAVSGEWVSISGSGHVSVNNEPMNEPYVAALSLGSGDVEFPYHVPAGTVFVLGDNRAASDDSRNSEFGPVRTEQILGKVIWKAWPLSRGEYI